MSKEKAGIPPQAAFIVGNEACERFSFYGMRSILVVYMMSVLLMEEDKAMEVYHLFTASIYILPLLGAWVADQFLGRYRTILFVSLFYCVGHGVLATADLTDSLEVRQWILFCGLTIIALGAGGIKPCVSSFVGDQVDESQKAVMTRVYAAFYWSINLGSFFSFLVVPMIRQNWGYGWAFGIPGIFMALATFIFWCGRHYYRHREPVQPKFLQVLRLRVFGGADKACAMYGGAAVAKATSTAIKIAAFIVVAPIIILLAKCAGDGGSTLAELGGADKLTTSLCGTLGLLLFIAALTLAGLKLAATFHIPNFFGTAGSMLFDTKEELQKHYTAEQCKSTRNFLRVLVVFMLIIPFWSLFEQTGSSWIIQGKKMVPIHFSDSFQFGAEEMQSINPVLVMLFIPAVTLLVYPYIGRWGSPLKRMGIGIVLAGVSYACVACLQTMLDAKMELCILWQSIPYAILTLAEIFVSTTGLEYAYTAAGRNMKSVVSSFWFLTSTLGNLLVIYLTSLVSDPASTSTFLLYGGMSVAVGLAFMYVTSRRAMQPEE